MYDNLELHFLENVIQPFKDYRKIRLKNNAYGLNKDLRSALTCASSLYHFREYVPIQK